MHREILNINQEKQWNLLQNFATEYLLVGGTSISLQIGHRESIDFDLCTQKAIRSDRINTVFYKYKYKIDTVLVDTNEEFTCVVDNVKWTFFSYPFPILGEVFLGESIHSPDLLGLAAMKAYALGRRGKWKDYVDLFILMKQELSVKEIAKSAKEIFNGAFSEKMFRQQLLFWDDIDYSEEVVWVGETHTNKEIYTFLEKVALELD